jgi:hypothetical protein
MIDALIWLLSPVFCFIVMVLFSGGGGGRCDWPPPRPSEITERPAPPAPIDPRR